MVVEELIDALSKYPPEAPVELEDADTGWRITVIHIEAAKELDAPAGFRLAGPPAGTVVLSGEYKEMVS